MNHRASAEDSAYLSAFESFAIDPEQFHHREHLRIAYVLLCNYGVDGAYRRIRSGILGFLNHLGVGEAKYHETITRAWVLAVNHFMHTSRQALSFEAFIAQNAILLDQTIMGTHYSQSRLDSDRAKAEYVEPDLEPIPLYQDKTA